MVDRVQRHGWHDLSIPENELLSAAIDADKNANGSLRDPADRLPKVKCGEREGAVLVSPELQAWYRKVSGPGGASTRPSAGIFSSGRMAVPFVLGDSSRTTIDPADIAGWMRANGGHLVRLDSIAHLFPNARIRGEGATLRQLSRIVVRTEKRPEGVLLGEAFLDPGGEIIVSHFYEYELKKHAPSFVQFSTNKKNHDHACHERQSFFRQHCRPDSWPVNLDTLLSMGSLSVPLKGSPIFSTESRAKRERVVTALHRNAAFLPAVSAREERIEISLRNTAGVRKIIEFINERFPELYCDPSDPLQMADYLGVTSAEAERFSDGMFRRVLLAILDDPDVSLFYDNSDADSPALFNAKAIRPTLHFTARISPKNPGRVIFGIYHIDAQSYAPTGNHVLRSIDGNGRPPHHQGEVEPVYLVFDRNSRSPQIRLVRAYLGDHYTAEPIEAEDYTGIISVAYGSGGRILLPRETAFLPAAMLRTGARSLFLASASTFTRIFPLIEVYPGRSDLEGDWPNAFLFKPGDYHMAIEGEGGDFIPTGRLLSKNGRDGNPALNTSGYPFLRGSRIMGGLPEHNRLEVSYADFIKRQDKFYRDHLMGDISSVIFGVAGNFSRPLFSDGTGFSLRHEVLGLNFIGPFTAEGYVFNPVDLVAFRNPPQMGFVYYYHPEEPDRFRVDIDGLTLRGGVMIGGLQILYQASGGFNITGSSEGVKAGGYVWHGPLFMYQRRWAEVRAGFEQYCSTSPFIPGSDRNCALGFSVGMGGRFRRGP